MTVKELIKVLKKCPQNAQVYVYSESSDIDIGTNYSPVFIDLDDNVCIFCDIDEKRFVKTYIAKQLTNS